MESLKAEVGSKTSTSDLDSTLSWRLTGSLVEEYCEAPGPTPHAGKGSNPPSPGEELAATRRKLPIVQVPNPGRFNFDTAAGVKTLLDLMIPLVGALR